ncbi:ATP-binding cassette domain-containing protein [Sphingobacterium daejeonense]|uniref:ATP-binding cassette domain-containing protein n=1 Tax=Sphingobacterium daejeonense TaxID=371142 RepID=UPI0010C3C7C9|nr:ATP-binding cassette domain-containing protein [Sphingobacterium daejeonense]VTP95061.1 Lipoprotein-releasing system ATP-binding protein LolD [Sphingobacterium daejeonense]
MSSTMILQVQHVFKNYQIGDNNIPVLNDINFEIETGSTVSIVGPSGSGKTTLLGLCAGLDQSSEGDIILNGIKLSGLSEDKLAEVRK